MSSYVKRVLIRVWIAGVLTATVLNAETRPDAASPAQHEKLTLFTAMHSFPYYRAYEKEPDGMPWIDFTDRPLAWNPFLGDMQAARLKAKLMEQAGADVYVQTAFYANGSPKIGGNTATGLNFVGRMLEATEGTSLRVAPEVVMIKRCRTYGLDDLAAFFRKFYDQYHDHPRVFRQDGRMVLFLWKPFPDDFGPNPKQFGPDDLQKVWDMLGDLRKEFYVIGEAGYLLRVDPSEVEEKWDDRYVQKMLGVCDDLFYWYSHPTYSEERLWSNLLAESLRRLAPGRPIIAGSRSGYYRPNVGSVNPYHGIGKLLELWDANQTIGPDWNFFYNWDDYGENGVIEPTRFNRGIYGEAIRALTRDWKELPPNSDPQWWCGTRAVAQRGEIIETDVVALNCPEAVKTRVQLSLQTPEGETIWQSPPRQPVARCDDQMLRWHFKTPTFSTNAGALVPVVTVQPDKQNKQTYHGLAPVRLTDHHPMLPTYRFVRLDELTRPQVLNFEARPSSSNTSQQATVQGRFDVESDRPIKRIELRSIMDQPMPYRSAQLPFDPENSSFDLDAVDTGGRLSWKKEARVTKASEVVPDFDPWFLPLQGAVPNENTQALVHVTGEFNVDTRKAHDPQGMVYLFVEYMDGGTWSTPPRLLPASGAPLAETTVCRWEPVDETTFRLEPVRRRELSLSLSTIGNWDFTEVTNGIERVWGSDRFGWPIYLGYGPNNRFYRGSVDNRPSVVLQGSEHYLHFDGNDLLRLADRVFPAGPFSLSLTLRAQPSDHAVPLVFHGRKLLTLTLQPDGRIEMERLGIKLISEEKLPPNQWSVVQVGDDGSRLWLKIGDTPSQTLEHEPFEMALNIPFADIVAIGAKPKQGRTPGDAKILGKKESTGGMFVGDIKCLRLSIDGSAPVP